MLYTDKLSDMVLEVFTRFTVSGVVFYLFAVWLPVFVFFRPEYDFLLTEPTVIILCSVVIGLLLDISKLYNLAWKLPRSKDIDKKYLEISIVRACGIKADEQKMSDKDYSQAINRISTHIHEVFIRIKSPEVYQAIGAARLYPHALFMALFSIALFILECIVICVLAYLTKFILLLM